MNSKKAVTTKYEESFLQFLKKQEQSEFPIKNPDEDSVQLNTVVLLDDEDEPEISTGPIVEKPEIDSESTIREPLIKVPPGEPEVITIGEEPKIISIDPDVESESLDEKIRNAITKMEEEIGEQNRHKCMVCPRMFSSVDNLESHILTHNYFKCKFCPMWSDDLKNHVLRHHGKQ